jgi:hypothetical protein
MYKIFTQLYFVIYIYKQGDQKVSMHLMITIQKVTSNVQNSGVPRNFSRGGAVWVLARNFCLGGSTNSVEDRAERTEIWGR